MYMNYSEVDTLVLSGGGSAGVMTLGALMSLETFVEIQTGRKMVDHFAVFAGVSVGALIATHLALGMSPMDIYAKLVRVIPSMRDMASQWSISRLFGTCALLDPGTLRSTLEELLPDNPTFAELMARRPNKQLRVFTCNIDRGELEEMSTTATPGVRVIDAVMASMAIPMLYPPVSIAGSTYVDGGLVASFPIGHFDARRCIGVWIVGACRVHPKDRMGSGLVPYVKRVAHIFMFAQERDMMRSAAFVSEWATRTVLIRTELDAVNVVNAPKDETTARAAIFRGVIAGMAHMMTRFRA